MIVWPWKFLWCQMKSQAVIKLIRIHLLRAKFNASPSVSQTHRHKSVIDLTTTRQSPKPSLKFGTRVGFNLAISSCLSLSRWSCRRRPIIDLKPCPQLHADCVYYDQEKSVSFFKQLWILDWCVRQKNIFCEFPSLEEFSKAKTLNKTGRKPNSNRSLYLRLVSNFLPLISPVLFTFWL